MSRARLQLEMRFNSTDGADDGGGGESSTMRLRLGEKVRFALFADDHSQLRIASVDGALVTISASVNSQATARDRGLELNFDPAAAAFRLRFVDDRSSAEVEIVQANVCMQAAGGERPNGVGAFAASTQRRRAQHPDGRTFPPTDRADANTPLRGANERSTASSRHKQLVVVVVVVCQHRVSRRSSSPHNQQ